MKSMRSLGAICAFASALAAPCFAAGPTLSTLAPGAFREIPQNLKVNVVFVGFQQGSGPNQIDTAAFQATLPKT